jgi:GT2 family glycosyltransferase
MRPDAIAAGGAPPSFSIIICAYTLDRWEDLCEAIASARAQEPPVKEVILVCDHNSELQSKAEAAFPDVTVIANAEKRGISGARNSGIVAASGEILGFLDDDVQADKKWAANLGAEFESPDIFAVFPLAEPQWEGHQPSWFPDEFLWAVGCSYRGLPRLRTEVRNIIGGACLYRRDLFERAGCFNRWLNRTDSKVPISNEETEICIRASQLVNRAKFVFQPSITVRHKVPRRRQTWSYFTLRCYAEGLSKAYLVGLAGAKIGLSSERRYVLRTLPAGFARGIGDAIFRFDMSGLGRAFAILWGLSCACAGYARGRLLSPQGEVPGQEARNAV